MKHLTRLFIASMCGLFLAALLYIPLSSPQRFTELCDEFFKEELSSNSLTLHYTVAEPENYDLETEEITLGSYDGNPSLQRREVLKKICNLQTIARSRLSDEQKLTYDLLQYYLKTELDRPKFSLLEEPLVPSVGIQSQLPVLLAEYRFENEADIQNYLALLSCVPECFDSLLALEEEKCEKGLFMDKETAEELIDYCTEFLAERDSHFLSETFDDRLSALNLSSKKYASYRKKHQTCLEEDVFPSYEKLKAFLEANKDSGSNPNGLFYYTKGTDYYAWLIRSQIGIDHSFEEIEKMLERALKKDAAVIADLVKEDPELLSKRQSISIDTSNPAALTSYLSKRANHDFPEISEVSLKICEVPKSMEEYLSPAFYLVPAIDRCEENVVYLNRGQLKNDLSLFTTLAHESYPGHLYQTVYENACSPHPIRRLLYFGGCVEGWATYAEQCSYDYAPISKELAALLSSTRAMTLNIYSHLDLYVHAFGWTEEDCAAYLKKFGITNTASVHEMFLLVKQQPTNYLKYYLGYLEICNLRDEAKKQLGNSFELKEFHKFLLDHSPAPFELLDQYLEEWIENQSKPVSSRKSFQIDRCSNRKLQVN